MRNYCQLLGLLNLLMFSGTGLWLIADGVGYGAPIVTAALTLNMAMAWLFLSGIHRNAAGERVWHSKPAVETIILFFVLLVLFFAYGRKG